MATLNFPTLSRSAPSELSDWKLIANNRRHTSPFTRSRKSVSIPGSQWAWVAVWRNLGPADRALLSAFLAELDGTAGRFYYSHPMFAVPRGTARGAGTCSAAAQFAQSITLNELAAGATLLKGDFVQVGTGTLLMATADATANGSGALVLNFRPMLVAAVAGATAFTLASPRGQFEIADETPGMPVLPGPGGFGLGNITIQAIESF
jgi:hypothetical protein